MAEMKRTAGADLGPRSFYATTLEAEGHQHDARAEWKALAREYPNEPEIVQRGR
jgi:cytochrome c-type biogenesis protein CcmH/NrfG